MHANKKGRDKLALFLAALKTRIRLYVDLIHRFRNVSPYLLD